MNTIGQRLKDIRLKVGATQMVFASKLGTTQSFLSSAEKDKWPPTEAMLDLLALNYGVNKQWVLTGDGEIFLEGYISKVEPETISNVVINNYELLEMIIMHVENYLASKGKVATPAAKAKFIIYFYKHFTKNRDISDLKDVKKRIESSIDVLATVVED
jgi:transcriptional regulator with XRE-family HTH domain